MRTIHLDEGLRVRFPGREGEFNDGFEIGAIAGLMSLDHTEISRRLSSGIVEQAEILAGKLGYHLAGQQADGDTVQVTFRVGRARPKLRLVHSSAEEPSQTQRSAAQSRPADPFAARARIEAVAPPTR